MCFGDESGSTTQKVELPQWVTSAGQKNLALAKSIADTPYESYGGERVAGFSPDQFSGFDAVRDAATNVGSFAPAANEFATQAGSTAADRISAPSLIDESAGSGFDTIAAYQNPYLSNVLDPALRGIAEKGAQSRNQIGAGAHAAGAFGDARHGIVESQQYQDEAQLASDTVGRGLHESYTSGLNLRNQDIARSLGIQQYNAGATEKELSRMLQAAGLLPNIAGAEQGQKLNAANALLSSGGIQQGNEQSQMDVDYADFLEQRDKEISDLNILVSTLAGTPYGKTSTQTEESPNNILGSLAGTAASTALSTALSFI